VSMYWSGSTDSSSAEWNNTTHSYYYSGAGSANHDVAIVGWDDNYSKTNFSTTPPEDGAFIVRNSWGSGWGNAGYFYVSYDDGIFGRSCSNGSCSPSYSFREAEPIMNFSRVYQYDPFGWVSSVGYTSVDKTTGWFANIFTAVASERLSAVSFYAASPNSPYTIYIYGGVTAGVPRSGTLAATQTGTLQLPGYNTISLSSPVNLTSGEAFSIVVKLTTPGYSYPIPYEFQYPGYTTAATASPGQSFISQDGNGWMDLTSWEATANVCLKGFIGPNSSLYAGFAGNGVYLWDGTTWTQITPNAPTAMAVASSLLYGNFGAGAGIWKWDGSTWSQITPNAPTSMTVSGSLLYGNFGTGAGIWKWGGTTWTQITPNSATAMAASGSLLYGSFWNGIWKWDGTTWIQIATDAATAMVASGPLLYGAFGTGTGIWKCDGSVPCIQITPYDPASMAVDTIN
jgi:hypothetical protein